MLITDILLGEALYAPSLPAVVKVSSKFGDHGDPRQLLVEGFLADPMTGFNNPTVVIRDILGRVVFKLEIMWKADFLHYIDVTSELNDVSIFKSVNLFDRMLLLFKNPMFLRTYQKFTLWIWNLVFIMN